MARPTKLTPALIKKARDYDYKAEGDVIPSIEGLTMYLEVARSSVYLWAQIPKEPGELTDEQFDRKVTLHSQFSDIVNAKLTQQGRILLNEGLIGKFNPKVTSVLLSKHGYVEKRAEEHTGKDGGPIETKAVEVMDVGSANKPEAKSNS